MTDTASEGTQTSAKRLNVKYITFLILQTVIVLIVIVASIVNLSLSDKNKELWESLLSGFLGIALPRGRIYKKLSD